MAEIPQCESNDILCTLKRDHRFEKLSKVIEINENLQKALLKKDITIFAPTNECLDKLFKVGNANECDLEKILMYHIVNQVLELQDMYDHQLLDSELYSEELQRNQKIHVRKDLGAVTLNWNTIVDESGFKTSNGIVHPIDFILFPPYTLLDQIVNYSSKCSTFASALRFCDLSHDISKRRVTCFVPTNEAFKTLDSSDLIYLFSPQGRDDLKKVLQYHICDDVLYATSLLNQNKKLKVKTFLNAENLSVEFKRLNLKTGFEKELKEKLVFSPNCHKVILNDGEAELTNQFDCLSENGTFHLIDAVLLPNNVISHLPSTKG